MDRDVCMAVWWERLQFLESAHWPPEFPLGFVRYSASGGLCSEPPHCQADHGRSQPRTETASWSSFVCEVRFLFEGLPEVVSIL